jgi:hypothetical protein
MLTARGPYDLVGICDIVTLCRYYFLVDLTRLFVYFCLVSPGYTLNKFVCLDMR